jgi:ketosteroid isomerase-like protein
MKTKFFLFIFISFVLTGVEVKTFVPDESSAKNLAVAKKVFEYFNQHEWEKMAALYLDPAEFLDPAFGAQPVKQTRRQTAEKYREMEAMSKDIRDQVVQIYQLGDKTVAVEFVSSGTAPDGTKWSLPICTIFTIENGLITKDHTYYDNPSEK